MEDRHPQMAEVSVGIDFGTSNSLVAVATAAGDVRALPADPINTVPELLPSLLFFGIRGRSSVGRQAWLDHVAVPDESEGRFIRALKSALPEYEPGEGVRIFSRRYEIRDLVALVLARLRATAEECLGEPVTGAVFGRPVMFGETPAADARAEGTLREAAVRAGFDPAQTTLLTEPEAVMRLFFARERLSWTDATALVFDFGGGTLDLCLARCGADRPSEVIGVAGVRVGGTTLDRILFDEKLLLHFGKGQHWGPGLELPTFLLQRLINPDESWRLTDAQHAQTARHVLNATRAAGRRSSELTALATVATGRKGPEVFAAIEEAKCALSHQMAASIRYHYKEVALDEPLDRPELMALFHDDLHRIERAMLGLLAAHGRQPRDVDVVLLAGGSSNLVAAQELLRDMFGAGRLPLRDDLFTSVAQGLAVAGLPRPAES
jgi:hypothetical chaperone protein